VWSLVVSGTKSNQILICPRNRLLDELQVPNPHLQPGAASLRFDLAGFRTVVGSPTIIFIPFDFNESFYIPKLVPADSPADPTGYIRQEL